MPGLLTAMSALILSGKAVSPARRFLPRPDRQTAIHMIAFSAIFSVVVAGCAGVPDPVGGPQLEPVASQHVTYADSEWLGRSALKLALTAEEQARQLAGAGGNRPTLIVIGTGFSDGMIEVDIAASINGKGGEDARGFVGIAFHIDEGLKKFEAVYLRFSNGTLNLPPPPPPRDVRAVQYIAHPGFHFEESRRVAPGQYEKPAAIALGQWHRLRIEIDHGHLRASVDGTPVLEVNDLRYAGKSGQFGIWVGDGTDAYIADFSVAARLPQERTGSVEGPRGNR